MNKKKRERISSDNLSSPYSLSSKLNQEEVIALEKAKELLLPIREKYGLTSDGLKGLLEEELSFPAAILNKKLTVLESVVKYLRQEKNLSLSRISGSIGRDQRNVWHIDNDAGKKHPEKLAVEEAKFWIPVSILSKTKLSALESVVSYLKENYGLTYHAIALLLKRDDRTVWTVYQRARKKNG